MQKNISHTRNADDDDELAELMSRLLPIPLRIVMANRKKESGPRRSSSRSVYSAQVMINASLMEVDYCGSRRSVTSAHACVAEVRKKSKKSICDVLSTNFVNSSSSGRNCRSCSHMLHHLRGMAAFHLRAGF